MNTWLEATKFLLVLGAVTVIFYVGTIAGDLKATVEFEEVIHDQEQLINLMMIAGRKRRDEIKRLKKKLNGNAITMRMDADGNLYWN